jgi:hypothetical protein
MLGTFLVLFFVIRAFTIYRVLLVCVGFVIMRFGGSAHIDAETHDVVTLSRALKKKASPRITRKQND